MVSAGTVKSDSSTFLGYMSNYQTEIEGLTSSWKGPSFDNLQTKASEFISEYKAIVTQMDSFATACDLYTQYDMAKQNYNISVDNYNKAVASNDTSSLSKFQNDVNTYSSQMNSYKAQIQEALNAAATPTLTANASGNAISSASIASSSSAAPTVVAEKAVNWAISIANDNSHGYVAGGYGPDYDCSSLINQAYENAGIPFGKIKYYTNNASMVKHYQPFGFEWHEGTPKVEDLKAGDILVNHAHHVELYIGDGKKLGAHSNYDEASGDSRGNEISIDDYKDFSNGGWDGFLRYAGTNP